VIASERVQFRLLTGFVHAARLKEGSCTKWCDLRGMLELLCEEIGKEPIVAKNQIIGLSTIGKL
jgi:hypothetical protein